MRNHSNVPIGMDFSTVSRVVDVIERMKTADGPRSKIRSMIDWLFNGNPPWTEEEAAENRIQTNYNSLEGPTIMHNARGMWNNAFLKPGNYFGIRLDHGPIHKRTALSRVLTTNINRCMKRSLPFTETTRAEGAGVMMHGIAPSFWETQHRWRARPLPIGDLLVPSRTTVDLENLDHFAISRRYTPGQLYRMTHGSKVDQGWNMKLVKDVLKVVSEDNSQSNNYDSSQWPERWEEDIKANSGYWESDAVPTINCWDFFYRKEDDKDGHWERRVVLDSTYGELSGEDKFLYKPKQPYAKELRHFLYISFADGSNVAPFRYHTVRSLGWLLYAVCIVQNRLRCKFNDAVMESFLWYFRNVAAEDREKVESIRLNNMGIIPEGLTFVPGNERFQLQQSVVELALSQNRQLMAENSASFTQDVDTGGSQKELTATEVMARVNSANALLGAFLTLAYTYKTEQYREICRRFCIEGSRDPEVAKFRDRSMKEGVPESAFDAEMWDIEPERTLGDGNKLLEIAQADKLMAARNLYDSEAQQEILHIYTEANSNPKMAERLVPMRKKEPSHAVTEAAQNMGTLMLGLPVPQRRGMNHIDYIETLLTLMGQLVQRIEQSGGTTDEKTIIGLMTVAQEIEQHVQLLAQDDNEKERVKQYSDALGEMVNLITAYAQRLQEQMQSQGEQMSPEVMAKVQASVILAQSQAKIKEATAAQKMQHKDAAFVADQRRRDALNVADSNKKLAEAQVSAMVTDIKTSAEISNTARKDATKPKNGSP